VNCKVFFSNETQDDIHTFLLSPFEIKEKFILKATNLLENEVDTKKNDLKNSKANYLTFLEKNIELIGKDTLNKPIFNNLLDKKWISRKSKYFSDDLYNSFKRYLQPSFHSLDDGRDFKLTKKQIEFSESKAGDYKIRGVAGSGKTLVLAQRAVNAYKRTNDKVLILSYNSSLKNYIHDKISNVREEFDWSNFHINTYHDFITNNLNNFSIAIEVPKDFDVQDIRQKQAFFQNMYYGNLNILEEHISNTPKYAAILIDEVQDYETIWLRIIKKYFLKKDGEFVVFGDSKQDIYNRVGVINQKKELVIPDSPGRWGELNESFRLPPSITSFALSYQKEFLADKHNLDTFENIAQLEFYDKVHYKYFNRRDVGEITDFIINFSKKLNSHPNDICVLSLSIDIIREIDFIYRKKTKEKSYITSETQEFYNRLFQQHLKNPTDSNNVKNRNKFDGEIEIIRKSKKLHFWMNSGMIKFSTVHSFKGSEIKTLFLIVEKGNREVIRPELIYTGFTRCMNNLVILNIDDEQLDSFINKLDIVLKE